MSAEAYRRVVPTFWSDPDVKRRLNRDQKLLALYFFTSPHSNMIGLYYCPLAYVAAETDVPVDEVRRALLGPLAPFISYDEDTEEVFVHGLAKHNVGDKLTVGKDKRGQDKPDHRIAGVRKLAEAAHSRRLLRAFLLRYADGYQLTMPIPDDQETPSKPLSSPLEGVQDESGSPLPSPFEAKAVAVAVSQHDTALHNSSDTSYPAAGRSESIPVVVEAEEPHTMGTVLGLVVDHLYFGTRPPEDQMKVNASCLKALNEKRKYSWNDLARAVIGLADRRNKGEIGGIATSDTISCKWLYSDKPVVNQVSASEDAYYRSGPPPPSSGKRGGITGIGETLAQFKKGA